MVESLEVKNFRCFQDLKLRGLRTINLIVGLNSSGKTSLLESIFIAAGANPEIAIRIRAFRGLGQMIQLSADRTVYESLWRDLFFNFNQSKTISCKLIGSPSNTRSLDISYTSLEPLTLPFGKDVGESPLIVPIMSGKIIKAKYLKPK
jgi:AAA15 family ATPase/GTPase